MIVFECIDADAKLILYAYFSKEISNDEKCKTCIYQIYSIDINGDPSRKNYVEYIRSLLEVHGIYYRHREKFEGLKQNVVVNFSSDALSDLRDWKGNVMPIINDRDNNKTIDTDTGIYVERVLSRPNE